MKKLAVLLLISMLFVLFVNTAFAAGLVYIEAPYEFSDTIAQAVGFRGAEVIKSKGEANTTVKVDVVELKTRMKFNWWILLLGLWPIVPWTRTVADATVNVTVMEDSMAVYAQRASESVKGQFVFGDIYVVDDDKVDELKAEAVREAVLKALAEYSF
ncbi:MAG TPA: hypothetical protein DHW84_06455 [Firmicutes bacterium]|nr:hypothetical protein [Bacillota bacterium]